MPICASGKESEPVRTSPLGAVCNVVAVVGATATVVVVSPYWAPDGVANAMNANTISAPTRQIRFIIVLAFDLTVR